MGELAVNPYYKAHIARQIMAIRPYLVNNEFLKIYLETKARPRYIISERTFSTDQNKGE